MRLGEHESARKHIAEFFVFAFLIVNTVAAAWSAPPRQLVWSAPQLKPVDDKLLVLLSQHADREHIKADLLKYAQATTVNDIHFDSDDYSILVLSPPLGSGKRL